MKHFGDITKLSGYDLPPVDIITGGSPCQDLSVAGKRAGLAGERSGLFMEQIRIIKEMRDESIKRLRVQGADVNIRDIKPRFMVWENVPGAFSSNGGEDFRAVLEETAKIVCEDAIIPRPPKGKWMPSGCIMGDGWSIAWRVHDAQFWGVPQRRKRIALIADFGGGGAPEILFERKSVSGDIESSRQEGKGVAGCVKTDIGATGEAISFQERAGCSGGGKGILIQHERTGALSTINNQSVLNRESYVMQSQGFDAYNQNTTGDVSKPLNNADTDSDHVPCVYTLNGKDTTPPLDAHYYLGAGARSGVEREAVLMCEDKPKVFSDVAACRGAQDGRGAVHSQMMSDPEANFVVETKVIGNGQTAQMGLHDKTFALDCMHEQQAVITYGIDRASFNQGANAQYNFSVEEEKAQTLVAKGPGGVLTGQ